MSDHNHQTNGRAMYHDYGKDLDAREQEEEREKCTCGYVWHEAWGRSEWETCPLHTPPEPEGC